MQLAWMTWMQAAMQADYTGHEALQAYTGQEIDIDIAAELLHIADEGLAVVANAVHLADCLLLRVQLGDISDTFADIKTTPADYHQHPRGDYLELRAANALKQVDELLRQQTALEAPPLPPAAIAELKLLQRHAQDVAVQQVHRPDDLAFQTHPSKVAPQIGGVIHGNGPRGLGAVVEVG